MCLFPFERAVVNFFAIRWIEQNSSRVWLNFYTIGSIRWNVRASATPNAKSGEGWQLLPREFAWEVMLDWG